MPGGQAGGEGAVGKAAADAPSGQQVLDATNALVRREIRTTVGLGFFINLLVLASPIYMMQVFDRVLPTGHVEKRSALRIHYYGWCFPAGAGAAGERVRPNLPQVAEPRRLRRPLYEVIPPSTTIVVPVM